MHMVCSYSTCIKMQALTINDIELLKWLHIKYEVHLNHNTVLQSCYHFWTNMSLEAISCLSCFLTFLTAHLLWLDHSEATFSVPLHGNSSKLFSLIYLYQVFWLSSASNTVIYNVSSSKALQIVLLQNSYRSNSSALIQHLGWDLSKRSLLQKLIQLVPQYR